MSIFKNPQKTLMRTWKAQYVVYILGLIASWTLVFFTVWNFSWPMLITTFFSFFITVSLKFGLDNISKAVKELNRL